MIKRSLHTRLARIEARQHLLPTPPPPRSYLWRMGDPPPAGMRVHDSVVRLPYKSASPEQWAQECFERGHHPPVPQKET